MQSLFRDSDVDPDNFDEMDYAQKRLLLLKSSKALITSSSAGGLDDSETDAEEPGILVLQNSSKWGSYRCGKNAVSSAQGPISELGQRWFAGKVYDARRERHAATDDPLAAPPSLPPPSAGAKRLKCRFESDSNLARREAWRFLSHCRSWCRMQPRSLARRTCEHECRVMVAALFCRGWL